MTANKQLGSAMIFYAIGTFLQRIGAFILVPLYTSVLLVSEYGALETITVTYQVFMILINFGLSNALIRFYHECHDDADAFKMVRSSWVSVIGVSIVLFAVVSPFFSTINSFLLKENQSAELISLSFFWAVGGALNQQYFGFYRARQEARTYIILSIIYFVLSTSLNILFVRFLNLKVIGVLIGNLVVVWGINLIAFIKFFGRDRSLSMEWTKKLFGFGFPLLFGIISWQILNSADRYFIAYYRDLSEVAIYGLGYKVGLIAQISVVTPFQLAWAPYMFTKSVSSTDNVREEFSRIFTYLLTAFSLVGMGIFLFSKEIINLFGSGKYAQAAEVIPFILIAYFFSGVFYWAGSFLNLTNKTYIYSIILILMAALNLCLDWLWIPLYGWQGAAWATVITMGGAGLITLIASEIVYPIRLEMARILKLIAVVGVILLAQRVFSRFDFLSNTTYSIILFLLFPVLLSITGYFLPLEQAYIQSTPGKLNSFLKNKISRDLKNYSSHSDPLGRILWKKSICKLVKWLRPVISLRGNSVAVQASGGISETGFHDSLVKIGAELLNDFVNTENISTVIEFGCGDGKLLSLFRYPIYTGFDNNPKSLDLCKQRFAGDKSKSFKLTSDYAGETADLTLSIDVFCHMEIDSMFFHYMELLFNSSEKYVFLCSSTKENQTKDQDPRIYHANLSNWIRENRPQWELIKHIPYRNPVSVDRNSGPSADFYIYKKYVYK